MTTLALHPRELGGIESAKGSIEPIVTKETVDLANAVMKNVARKVGDLTKNKVTLARESTEQLMGDFIRTRTPGGISPGECAAAVASTEELMRDFIRRAL